MRGFMVRRVGPLPLWVWLIVVTVGVYLFLRFRGGGGKKDDSDSSTIYDAENLTTQQSTLVPWSTDIFINVPASSTPAPTTSPTPPKPGPSLPPKMPGPRRYMIRPNGTRVWIDPAIPGQYSGKTQRIQWNKAETAPRRYSIMDTGKRIWLDLTGVDGRYSGKTQRVPFTGGGLPPTTFNNRVTSVSYQVPPGTSGAQAAGLARLFGFQGQARPFASNPLVIPT